MSGFLFLRNNHFGITDSILFIIFKLIMNGNYLGKRQSPKENNELIKSELADNEQGKAMQIITNCRFEYVSVKV